MRVFTIAKKLWVVIAKELGPMKEKGSVGRPAHDAKRAFLGVLFILENGSKWKHLPRHFGAKSTVHEKYMCWARQGSLGRAFALIRELYRSRTGAFVNWLAVDTSSSKAPMANFSGKNPTDRGKRGVKKGILCDSRGAPMAISVSPANMHDSKTLKPLLQQARALKPTGLVVIAADSAYDSRKLRQMASKLGFVLHAATNKRRSKTSLIIKPKGRWVVEVTHSWLNNFRAVKTCFAKSAASFLGFVTLAATIRLFQMI